MMVRPLLDGIPAEVIAECAIGELLGGDIGIEITRRHHAGESLRQIAVRVGVSHTNVAKRAAVNAERLERVARLAERIQAIEHKSSNVNRLRVLRDRGCCGSSSRRCFSDCWSRKIN